MERYSLNGGESTSEPYVPEASPLDVSPSWSDCLENLPDVTVEDLADRSEGW
jgi:hypothetical protein